MALLFTREELEQRNRKEDAAIIIDNVVYDVTRFLEDHPGGIDILLENAGKDASKCFHNVGHSEDAKLWRNKFKVGEVVEADRWEVFRPPTSAGEAEPPLTVRGLVEVWAPPLALAALATALYVYLF